MDPILAMGFVDHLRQCLKCLVIDVIGNSHYPISAILTADAFAHSVQDAHIKEGCN
jgi:hypothetical protein